MNTVFYLSAAVAVIATFMVITRLNAIHALLYLIVSLFAVAVAFYTLGAPFVAALEVVIYAGAIMVLFVFVVMLLNLGEAAVTQERGWLVRGAWIGPGILMLILVAELLFVLTSRGRPATSGAQIDPRQVGMSLYGPYLIGVELASMLLLAGLVGAYHIGRRQDTRKSLMDISRREFQHEFIPEKAEVNEEHGNGTN